MPTAGVVAVFTFVVTLLIATVVNRIISQRVRRRQENLGLDLAQHGESAYDLTTVDKTADVIEQPTASIRS